MRCRSPRPPAKQPPERPRISPVKPRAFRPLGFVPRASAKAATAANPAPHAQVRTTFYGLRRRQAWTERRSGHAQDNPCDRQNRSRETFIERSHQCVPRNLCENGGGSDAGRFGVSLDNRLLRNCYLFETFRVDQQMLRCELDPLDSLPHREQARPVDSNGVDFVRRAPSQRSIGSKIVGVERSTTFTPLSPKSLYSKYR